MADTANKARPGEPNPATTDPNATSADSGSLESAEPSKSASMRATLRWPHKEFKVNDDIPVITNEGTMLTKPQAEIVEKSAKANEVDLVIEEVK